MKKPNGMCVWKRGKGSFLIDYKNASYFVKNNTIITEEDVNLGTFKEISEMYNMIMEHASK